jgi:hypothetical protein
MAYNEVNTKVQLIRPTVRIWQYRKKFKLNTGIRKRKKRLKETVLETSRHFVRIRRSVAYVPC